MTSSPAHAAPEVSLAWRRPHLGFMLVEMTGTLRSLVVPFVLVFLGGGGLGDPLAPRNLVVLGIFAAIILASLAWNIMEWRFFRYALAPDRLLVRSGWISRQERSVPYQRIQGVDVVETPSYRVLGLARLRVETAAGGMLEKSEVDIKAVSRAEALAVREHLLHARQVARTEVPDAGTIHGEAVPRQADAVSVEGEPVRTMSMRDLLVAGATSGTIGPAAAVIGAMLSMADDIVPNAWWERVPWDRVEDLTSSLAALGILVLAVAILAWLMAIAGTVIVYHGFELRRTDEHLLVQHGLLDKRRATIPVRRIQAIRIEEGILRQPFGYVSVRYSSAGQGGKEEGGSGMLVPFMRRADVVALLERIAPEFVVDLQRARLQPLPPRALPRYIVMETLGAAVVVAGLMMAIWLWRDGLPWWGFLPLVVIPFQMVMGWLAYRDAGWLLEGRTVVLRSRFLARSTLVTSRRRVQHRSISANPFQRRAGLVTLHVAIASGLGGGTTSLAHIDREDGERMLFALGPRPGS